MASTVHGIQTKKRKKKSSDHTRWLGRYVSLPHHVINNQRYRNLSMTARALLTDLCKQLNGFNNGDIAAAQSMMKSLGWKDSTRKRALKELQEQELLLCTRVGGKHRCSLYAVTWLPIDECKGKLDLASGRPPWINFIKENNLRKNNKTPSPSADH